MISLWRDPRGGAAIEFAVVAPFLFTLVLGALDLGRMFYVGQGLQYAAEQGARYYTVNPTTSSTNVTSQVQAYMPGGMGSSVNVAYSDTASCNSNSSVTCTTITATYSFRFIASYLGLGTKTITAASQAVRVTP
jgi:Flp pilus assembly protein TadG